MESKNDSPVAPPPRDPSPASGPPTLPVLDAGANIDRRYRVLNILGRGGSALVLQVLDRLEDTVQALKILTKWEPGGVQRFQREFRLMASMRHPNIVTVNRYGVFEGHPYFTMENIQGISIRTFCQRSGIAFNQNNDPSEVLRRLLPLLTQICDALAFIHSRNVVHQDVKPANIFIRTDGAVKLMDFGIAQEPFAADAVTDLSGLLLGTVFYMSPEQVLRQPVDLRSDLYSLGVLLYELATGERPFIGPDVREVFAEIARGQPLQPRELNPHVPESFEHIISRLLERNPSRRPRSAEQLKRMLLSLPEIRAGSVIDGPETPRQGALLPPRLSGRETEVQHLTRALEALTRGIMAKIAHAPIAELRKHAGEPDGLQTAELIRRVFRLEE